MNTSCIADRIDERVAGLKALAPSFPAESPCAQACAALLTRFKAGVYSVSATDIEAQVALLASSSGESAEANRAAQLAQEILGCVRDHDEGYF